MLCLLVLLVSGIAGGRGFNGKQAYVLAPSCVFVEQRHLKIAFSSQRCKIADSCCDRADRKSTRLNSSHVRISYAVFCLKKKKKNKMIKDILERKYNSSCYI